MYLSCRNAALFNLAVMTNLTREGGIRGRVTGRGQGVIREEGCEGIILCFNLTLRF